MMPRPAPLRQAEAIYHRRIGGALLTAINDGYLDFPFSVLNGIDAADAALMLDAHFQPGTQLHLTVNAFLVRSEGQAALIDTGSGSLYGPTAGRLLSGLAAAGVEPAAIRTVLLTHLHGDHIGGLTAASGDGQFPNAEILAHESEIAFWLDEANERRAPAEKRGGFAAARAALAPYRARLKGFGNGAGLLADVQAVHLPGHTPGHSGFRIGGASDALLIWGDICHVPAIQARRPEVAMVFDVDPAQARETRRRLLEQAASERLRVGGMHLHFPGFAHVVREASGYALLPEAWDPAL